MRFEPWLDTSTSVNRHHPTPPDTSTQCPSTLRHSVSRYLPISSEYECTLWVVNEHASWLVIFVKICKICPPFSTEHLRLVYIASHNCYLLNAFSCSPYSARWMSRSDVRLSCVNPSSTSPVSNALRAFCEVRRLGPKRFVETNL